MRVPVGPEIAWRFRFSDHSTASGGLPAQSPCLGNPPCSIGNIYDYTDALSSFKAGDVVETEYVRDGKKMATKITMGKR